MAVAEADGDGTDDGMTPLNVPTSLEEVAYDIASLNHIPNVDKIVERAVRTEDGSLKSWDLSSLGLEELPASLGIHAMRIQGDLDCSRNHLAELPETFCRLQIEGSLLLQHNDLERLPPDFGDMAIRDRLDLSHNKLAELPASFGKLTLRGGCLLHHNHLTTLPEARVPWTRTPPT